MEDLRHLRFINITQMNYDALQKTHEHLENRIECQNRKPSDREQIAIEVIEQEIAELKSVLKLHNSFE